MTRAFGLRNPPALPLHPRLAFVETEADVRCVLSSSARIQIDAFVALEPEAAWALAEVGQSYLKLEDGYAESALCKLAQPVLDGQQAWVEWVDRLLQDRISDFRIHDFRPARLYLYWLKIMFDALELRAYTITHALQSWSPSQIFYPGGPPANQTFGWDLMYRDSLYPCILRQVTQCLGIEALLPAEPIIAGNSPQAKSNPNGWELVNDTMRCRLHSFLRALKRAVRTASAGGDVTGEPELILDDSYDLHSVWKLARQKRLRPTAWLLIVDRFRQRANSETRRRAERWMASAWHEMSNLEQFRQPMQPAGCDFWSLAAGRLHYWWHTLIPQQWAVYWTARRQFEKRPPAAIAVSGVNDHVERGVLGALRSLGTRIYFYQHGGFVGWCECVPWDVNDLALAHYELTHGHATSQYFASRRENSARLLAQPITVGSSRLDALRAQMARSPKRGTRRPRVLLIPNVIARHGRYLDCGNLPDVTEAEVQAEMVSAAREFLDYDFVFKAFPNQADTPAIRLARKPGSNCQVESKNRLEILMARSDLIVLNFPSTALTEALITDRPILLFADGRSIRMYPEAKAALAKRVMLNETAEGFIATYRKLLASGKFEPVVNPDQSFLQMYGTHLNDGRSAERALSAILNSPGPQLA